VALEINCAALREMGTAPANIRQTEMEVVHFDMSGWTNIRSFQLARARCLIDLAIQLRKGVMVTPPSRTSALNYSGRMGLFNGLSYVYPQTPQPPETFFPLTRIEHDRTEFLFDEMHRVLSLSNIPANYITRLCESFTELANNIYFHSGDTENSGWGYVHAQAYPHYRHIKIGISDVGVGFFGSYSRTGQIRGRTSHQIVRDAFEELESSLNLNPGRGYRGLGLSEVRNFVNLNSCKLNLWTGTTHARVFRNNFLESSESGWHNDGTLIELEVPIV
jgi:hypothetical protein